MVTDSQWPSVEWEEHPWVSSIPEELLSRRMRQQHSGEYYAAVPALIADRNVSVPSSVSALVDEASAEIVRFDAECGGEIAPFGAVLLRSESASSSEIENLTSSARSIALAEIGYGERSNAEQIVDNVHAMQTAIELADHLSLDAVLAMHAALMEHDRRHTPGHLRKQQVWIGGTSVGPHLAAFVPPHHSRVPELMDDMIAFAQREDIPTLTHAAIAHAQFETIHPFTDGNGRTGRAFLHAMLRAKELTRHVSVPLSAGLLTNTPGYFAALTSYHNGDAVEIVKMLAEATFEAITNGRHLVRDLQEIRLQWSNRLKARQDAAAWKLLDILIRQPVIDASTAERELGATSANTHRALRQLAESDILTEFTGKKRARLWQAREVLHALDDFAARAGRRTVF